MATPLRALRLLVALILAVGIGGTVVALESREGNAQFVLQQQSRGAFARVKVGGDPAGRPAW